MVTLVVEETEQLMLQELLLEYIPVVENST